MATQNEQTLIGWGQQPDKGLREEAILIDIDPIDFLLLFHNFLNCQQ